MKNNQFSIVKTSPSKQRAELTRLRLLDPADLELSPQTLWVRLLDCTHVASQDPAALDTWHDSLLATPDLSLKYYLRESNSVDPAVFYTVALQLLGFEPALDFDLQKPIASMKALRLPMVTEQKWDRDGVIKAFYLLLCTRGKGGATFLDHLTNEGAFTWTYGLPDNEKPVFFNGRPIACFDPHQLINEVVYVETDVDSDMDGKADLVKVEISRPKASGLKIPALFTASPYNQGTNDKWGEQLTHDVNQPLTHKDPYRQAPDEPKFSPTFGTRAVHGHGRPSEHFADTPTYTLNSYLIPRGYASVLCAGIGTKDSDGLQTCGSPEQTASMRAVVEWLHGDRVAFTDRTSGITTRADWCNGHVAMTGRSYLGTLSTAVATTGVKGLSAIISEAAISSWYDYYRENGLVRAAGGFQGEDADTLAAETYSRTKEAADYHRMETTNNRYLKAINDAMDRQTGNYNDFWAARNYRPHFAGIKCPVMMVHGLNDENVKPSNVYALYSFLADHDHDRVLYLHQGQHIYINAFQSIDFSETVNLWLADKCWPQLARSAHQLPHVIVQDNVTPQTWHGYPEWVNGNPFTKKLGKESVHYDDAEPAATYQDWCKHPAKWHQQLLKVKPSVGASIDLLTADSDTLLTGTPHLTVRIKSSANHGLVSAALIDVGKAKRLTVSPAIINVQGLRLGYHWVKDNLREFKLQKEATAAKLISRGHCNLQNPEDPAKVVDLTPGQFETVKFDLQPLFHHLAKGHTLRLVIFGTDYEMTMRGNEQISYDVDLSQSQLLIPGVEAYPGGHASVTPVEF